MHDLRLRLTSIRHFDQETNKYLKTIKYHGQNKESDMMKLRDADIIITTYHTLASDFASKRNRMNALEWYRLVLDEGIEPVICHRYPIDC
jgi:SNF2 family DNA or RNA helicase